MLKQVGDGRTRQGPWTLVSRSGEPRVVQHFGEILELIVEEQLAADALVSGPAGPARALGEVPGLMELFHDRALRAFLRDEKRRPNSRGPRAGGRRGAVARFIARVGLLVLGTSCSLSTDGLDVSGGGGAGAPRNGASVASAPEPAAARVVRAHDVDAKSISVGLLFAETVTAKNATITSSGPSLSPVDLQAQLGAQDLVAPEVQADVLYAHAVKTNDLSVGELHATHVALGKEGDGNGPGKGEGKD